jgi:hypothetical protein
MEQQVKRGRGRPPKAKSMATNPVPVEKDVLLSLIQQKFLDTYGFATTEAQSKMFLLTLVAQVEL